MKQGGWGRLVDWFGRRFARLGHSRALPQRVSVTFDSECVHVRGRGVDDSVRWDVLERVVIETNQLGPWCEDLYFIMMGSDGTGVVFGRARSRDALALVPRFAARELVALHLADVADVRGLAVDERCCELE